MRIDRINIYHLNLPFHSEFSHALTKRVVANNILVEILADQGETFGYGEGAPRGYVTGESQEISCESIMGFINKESFPWEIKSVVELWGFIDALPENKASNAALCALEIAILDAYSRSNKLGLMYCLPDSFFTERIFYGAAVPIAAKERIVKICRMIKEYEIKTLRIKVGENLEENIERIGTVLEQIGNNCDLRLDANGSWDYKTALAHLPVIIETGVKVLEQPLSSGDPHIQELSEQLRNNNITLMADERACSIKEIEDVIKQGCYGMINVRLSKCGGFRRSLQIIDTLRANDIAFQIGCQLGESGILSAAGRALGLTNRDAVYYDGSYDEFLLKENITSRNLGFGIGGCAGPLPGPGIGVEIDRSKIERLCGAVKITVANPNS